MQATQNQLIIYIKSLEDTIITLWDTKDNTVEYKKATKIAVNIERKKLDRKGEDRTDSDTSEELQSRNISPHFKIYIKTSF